MPPPIVQEFMNSLQHLEESGDAEPLLRLFDTDIELCNPARSLTTRGEQGARQFWAEYRRAFDQVHSHFTHVHATDELATLEWESHGMLPGAHPIDYHGVSVLEMSGGRIKRFATYYDSAAFVAPALMPHS